MAHARLSAWGLVVLLGVAGHASAAPPSYRVTELHGFVPAAINDRGDIVGNGPNGGVLYRDGQLTALGADFLAWDINDLGHIAGSLRGSGAAVWRDGSMQIIGPGGGGSINNQGWVIGSYPRWDGTEFGPRAFLYDGTNFQDLVDLYDPGGPHTSFTWANEINEAGDVIGGVRGDRAMLFANGAMLDVSPAAYSYGTALNDRGQAAGYFGLGTPYLYDNGVFSVVPLADFYNAEPVALNNGGSMLIDVLPFLDFYYSPRLYEDGQLYSLSDYLGPSGHDHFPVQAFDMNDAGQILAATAPRSRVIDGWFAEGSFDTRYVVLTPIPEPGTYALMIAGLLAVGAVRMRRFRRGR